MNEPNKTHQAEITFKTGASLKIEGNYILKDGTGKIIPVEGKIKLCRCGKTKTQPFCDHSHRTV
jgi:CDGSH-type Zn-finger protein